MPSHGERRTGLVAEDLTERDRRRRAGERALSRALAVATLLAAAPALAVVGLLLVRGLPAISLEFLFAFPTEGMTAGGLLPALLGTVWLVGVSLAFAVPVGVLAGIWLSEYAGDGWLPRFAELAVVNLAGVPSIVHALFGLGAFVLFFHLGTSILAAGLTLGVMTLPVIITSTRAALRSVPHAFRLAAWNLGLSRWQTIREIVLPNAMPGILTGVILQVSRAAGETAPILFTGAALYLPVLPTSPTQETMALSNHLFVLITQIPGVSDDMKYGTALVLLALVLAINAAAIAVRWRLRGRRAW
jgi:phosphate transport system permease protein